VSAEDIKKVLNSGTCPSCGSEVIVTEGMKEYYCSKDKSHFDLEISFKGGEEVIAKLNGNVLPHEDIKDIEW